MSSFDIRGSSAATLAVAAVVVYMFFRASKRRPVGEHTIPAYSGRTMYDGMNYRMNVLRDHPSRYENGGRGYVAAADNIYFLTGGDPKLTLG